jgi:hypothetical protein
MDGVEATLYIEMPGVQDRLDRIEQRQIALGRRLAAIERAVTANTINDIITTEALMADFTALHEEIEANGDAVSSAIALLNDLATRVADAADDPDEIRAIAAELGGQSEALAAAVVANTPAAPEPTEPPVDETPVDPEA